MRYQSSESGQKAWVFSIEDIAKKLLGDDYTEDWYPEEEQERDRRNMVISSYIASTTAALFWWVDG